MAGLTGKVSDRFPSEWSSIFSAHFLQTGRRATSGILQSEDWGLLMPDQHTCLDKSEVDGVWVELVVLNDRAFQDVLAEMDRY